MPDTTVGELGDRPSRRWSRHSAGSPGGQLDIDDAVYASERDTGHRNRAIAHLLRGTGAIRTTPMRSWTRTSRLCSVSITARDLALIAATLATGGRHPLTGERAASDATVRDMLSVMATCGMYDGAGEWMYEVGLPAKSGVSGGIFAVLPGQLGIGVWSPPLDVRGNSVRGVSVCRDLARELDLHLVRGARPPSPVRTRASVAVLPSKRARGAHERERISSDGDRSLVIELQGSLGFVATETLAREALPTDGAADAVVVDLRRVQSIDPAVATLLADLVAALGGRGAAVAWSGTGPHGDVLSLVDDALTERRLAPPRRFAELDLALEWAEDVVLSRFKGPATDAHPARLHVPIAEHPAFAGLDTRVVECLKAVMERRQFRVGDALVRHGEAADELFVITGGRLSVWVPVGAQDSRRLATLEAGQLVGELAFLGRERRTADVYCDTEVEAWVLTTDAFDDLARSDPATATVFLATLLRIVSGIARRMTAEVAHLAS